MKYFASVPVVTAIARDAAPHQALPAHAPVQTRPGVRTHGCMWSNTRMEIENPKSAEFVPLLGAFNFEH